MDDNRSSESLSYVTSIVQLVYDVCVGKFCCLLPIFSLFTSPLASLLRSRWEWSR